MLSTEFRKLIALKTPKDKNKDSKKPLFFVLSTALTSNGFSSTV